MRLDYNIYRMPAKDGVPVGPEIFNSFIKTLYHNIDGLINLTFSSPEGEITQGQGGYVETNPVAAKTFLGFNFASATSGTQGLVYGRSEDRFTLLKIPEINSGEDLPIYEWDLLASDFDRDLSNETKIVYRNDFANKELRLPYRPVKQNFSNTGSVGSFSYGFSGVRYNGVPQENIFNSISLTASDSLEKIEFSYFNFGAEFPNPVYENVYKSELENGITLQDFNLLGDANQQVELEFRYSNFADFGSHVLLRRLTDDGIILYKYIPEDRGQDNIIPAGTYRVVDRGRGIIKIRLNNSSLFELAISEAERSDATALNRIVFTVLCPEQLLEERQENYIIYKTRYGKVYSPAQSNNTELVRLFYSGADAVISSVEIDGFNFGSSEEKTDNLYYGGLEESGGTIILAINYRGFPVIDTEKQQARYFPDTINLFYTYGISDSTLAKFNKTKSDIRGFIDINKSFWYNSDVSTLDYNPVWRAENYFFSMIFNGENPNGIIFNPFVPIIRWIWGKPEPIYVYETKTTEGTKNEFIRRDSHFPEPHHVNPAIIRNTLATDEPFTVPIGETMAYPFEHRVEGIIIVEGTLVCN